jgi:hypothetical protein
MMGIGNPVAHSSTGSVLFIDGSGNLGQDPSNFSWDETYFRLHLGSATANTAGLFVRTLPALYVVPNANGNNWFEGNAGNFSVTGNGNFGTGDGALINLTNGSGNVAVGGTAATVNIPSAAAITTGTNNTVIGAGSLTHLTSGSNNVAIGSRCLETSTTDDNNFAVGFAALRVAAGANNTAVGNYSFQSVVGGGNVGIGINSGKDFTSGDGNTAIGSNAGQGFVSGDYNILIGPFNGNSASGVQDKIIITSGRTTTIPLLDYRWNAPNVWSMCRDYVYNTPSGLHIYNVQDAAPPTNYERAILDWNPTANVFRLASQAGGTGTVRLIAVDGFQKAGAPAAGDLPSGTFALINDTSGGQTWLAYNAAGTIRKVQLT